MTGSCGAALAKRVTVDFSAQFGIDVAVRISRFTHDVKSRTHASQ
jgi:hypothetical protein